MHKGNQQCTSWVHIANIFFQNYFRFIIESSDFRKEAKAGNQNLALSQKYSTRLKTVMT